MDSVTLSKNDTIDLEPITVAQARKILGYRADKLTDEQITKILNMFRLLCDKQIESAIKKNHSESNQKEQL